MPRIVRFRSARRSGLLLGCMAGATLLAAPLDGQVVQGSSGPAVLTFPSSALAGGLGHAPLTSSGSADLVFYHPALVDRAQGMATSWAGSARTGQIWSLAAATSWFGGDVALSVRGARYQSGNQGAQGLARFEGDLVRGGPQTVSETALSLTHAREVGPVSLGATAHLLDLSAGPDQDRGPAFDVGASLDVGVGFLAASVRSLGPDLSPGGITVELPTSVAVGIGTRPRPTGPLDLAGAAQVERLRSGDVRVGAGIQVGWWPVVGRTVLGRLGYAHPVEGDPAQGLTLGLGLRGDAFGLDYAWGQITDDANVHRLGVSWR